jgi:hypothetical protein
MLSVPRASAYLFNTSSLQANAEIFIRFQSGKFRFLLMIRPSAVKTGWFSAKEKCMSAGRFAIFLVLAAKLARYMLQYVHPLAVGCVCAPRSSPDLLTFVALRESR